MKKLLLLSLLFACYAANSQEKSNVVIYYRNLEAVPSDYNSEDFSSKKKATVRLLRVYLENKDKQRDDVDARIIRVNAEMNRNHVDTTIADKFINRVCVDLDSTALIDKDTRKLMAQLCIQIDPIEVKTIGDLESAAESIKDKVGDYKSSIRSLYLLDSSRNNIINDISQAHQRIDDLYSTLYDDGNFRKWITVIFSCIIIALLILFFGFIHYKSDTNLAKDFLSSGNGLQFIALFSLIVAIILFGVLGILEGRELAAILSGISGYILGKGISNPKQVNVQSKEPGKTASVASAPHNDSPGPKEELQ